MRLLLDENQHAKLIPFLASLGHDARFGEKRLPDPEVCRLAKTEDRIIVTYDKEYGELYKVPGDHCGMILLRISPLFLPLIKERLVALFSEWSEEKIRGTIVAVYEDRFIDLGKEGAPVVP